MTDHARRMTASPLSPCWNGKRVDANCAYLNISPPCPACLAFELGHDVPAESYNGDDGWRHAKVIP